MDEEAMDIIEIAFAGKNELQDCLNDLKVFQDIKITPNEKKLWVKIQAKESLLDAILDYLLNNPERKRKIASIYYYKAGTNQRQDVSCQ